MSENTGWEGKSGTGNHSIRADHQAIHHHGQMLLNPAGNLYLGASVEYMFLCYPNQGSGCWGAYLPALSNCSGTDCPLGIPACRNLWAEQIPADWESPQEKGCKYLQLGMWGIHWVGKGVDGWDSHSVSDPKLVRLPAITILISMWHLFNSYATHLHYLGDTSSLPSHQTQWKKFSFIQSSYLLINILTPTTDTPSSSKRITLYDRVCIFQLFPYQ